MCTCPVQHWKTHEKILQSKLRRCLDGFVCGCNLFARQKSDLLRRLASISHTVHHLLHKLRLFMLPAKAANLKPGCVGASVLPLFASLSATCMSLPRMS